MGKSKKLQEDDISKKLSSILSYPVDFENRGEEYRKIFSCIDLTTLYGNDNEETVKKICHKALNCKVNEKEILFPASVCVFPVFIKGAKKILKESPVKVATVCGGFPYGQMELSIKMKEIDYSLQQGADEIDFVASRRYLASEESLFIKEIKAAKEHCGEKKLKVILETGDFSDYTQIVHIGSLALQAGADFLKTSTGKVEKGATPEAVFALITSLKSSENNKGIKVSGGISEPEQAIMYYKLFNYFFPDTTVLSERFRIGCSQLIEKLLEKIKSVENKSEKMEF